jgi:hypothetical protein
MSNTSSAEANIPMASPNNTLVKYGQALTDAQGNVWTITADGLVAVNGAPDPTTANVTHLAYVDGVVWQENNSDLWWSKTSPTAQWDPPSGTAVAPLPIYGVPDESVYGAPAAGSQSSILDNSGNNWTISSGQVAVNGVADSATANVIQLAYVGGQIWQENNQGLWWYKTTPADGWSGGYGIPDSPIGTTYYVVNSPFDQAVVRVGTVTVQEPTTPPNALAAVVTTGFAADGTAIGVSAQGATIYVEGDSTLTSGAILTLLGAYRAPGPYYCPTVNDGTMTVVASTAHLGALSGTGSINASGGSTLDVQTAAASDMIALDSSHLTIGGQGGFGIGAGPAGGMAFLAPIAISGDSTITLANTQATSMVLDETGGALHEVFLYNGADVVADLKISGPSQLFAQQTVLGSTPAIALMTHQVDNALPMTIQS